MKVLAVKVDVRGWAGETAVTVSEMEKEVPDWMEVGQV